MWFDRETDDAWEEGLRPAIEDDAGFKAYRVDKDQENENRIDAAIETEIQDSRFLVADVTGGRQGVYFEAGFALGLGRQVIWTVRKQGTRLFY